MSVFKDKALALLATYTARGWRCFPVHTMLGNGSCSCGNPACTHIGKHPAVNWSSFATNVMADLLPFWSDDKPFCYNIGIATGSQSGITVIDIDNKHDGLQNWRNIAIELGENKVDTYTVATGGGGIHLYFQYSDAIKTGTNVLGPGIDVRNNGGYIVAPPSLHQSGSSYSIKDANRPLSPFPLEVLKLGSLLSEKQKQQQKLNKLDMPSLAKVGAMLDFIPNSDYATWMKVGIILGRAFNMSQQAWDLYLAWANKDYLGDKGPMRDKQMRAFFYDESQKAPRNGDSLSLATLVKLAKRYGFTELTDSLSVKDFSYLASENCFVFLKNGEKWLAAGVNNCIAPLLDEFGDLIKPSDWLIKHAAAASLYRSGFIPPGLIDGYYCSENGALCSLANARVINLFNISPPPPFSAKAPQSQHEDNQATPAPAEAPRWLAEAVSLENNHE